MPQNAEFYIKSISFSSIYDGWTKAPFAVDSAISNSKWSTSVNNDNSSSYILLAMMILCPFKLPINGLLLSYVRVFPFKQIYKSF